MLPPGFSLSGENPIARRATSTMFLPDGKCILHLWCKIPAGPRPRPTLLSQVDKHKIKNPQGSCPIQAKKEPPSDHRCHCEAAGRGNLQRWGVMPDAPINIESFGFTMLIGWLPGGYCGAGDSHGLRPRNDRLGSLCVLPVCCFKSISIFHNNDVPFWIWSEMPSSGPNRKN